MLIVGGDEAEAGTVAVRRRGTREQTVVSFERFMELARELRETKSLETPAP